MIHEPTARPFLIRAAYEWCLKENLTPYLLVYVDEHVEVPMEFVKDHQIILNLSPTSIIDLNMADDLICFSARFSGVSKEIFVPVDHVLAIFARETNVGMTFSVNPKDFDENYLDKSVKNVEDSENQRKSSKPLTRPYLNRIK